MHQETCIFIILGVLVILVCYFLYRLLLKLKLKKFSEYQFVQIELPKDFLKKHKKNEVENKLKLVGSEYQKTHIDQIIFIHGTFAGDDPFYLNSTFEKIAPNRFGALHQFVRKTVKGSFNFASQDKGNFTKKHVDYIERFFEQKASLFNWSGSNTHLARLNGAIKLIQYLDEKIIEGNKTIMIMAHSHGGQLLALLSQFLVKNELVKKLETEKMIDESIMPLIAKLKKINFIFVTMGTPVRYAWEINSKIQLFHLINHRGSLPSGGHLFGSLWTRGGDYVQQYGGAGSDYYAVVDLNSRLNKKLREILNEEEVSFFNFLKRKQRLHNKGMHFLIDYKDAKIYPNFYSSVFGHAVYTRYYLLSFHLQLILKHLNL